MSNKISYNVDNFGILHVYYDGTLLFEAPDFISTPKSEIEKFINENLNGEIETEEFKYLIGERVA